MTGQTTAELADGGLVMVPLPTADHSDVIDLLSDAFRANQLLKHRIVKRDVGCTQAPIQLPERAFSTT